MTLQVKQLGTQTTANVSARALRTRICAISCGGTIGMVRRDGKLCLPDVPLDIIDQDLCGDFDVEVVPLFNLDSSNMSPEHWQILAEEVSRKVLERFDGIVILHGTDTMSYTASALALALGPNLNCPVVLTGAQSIPEVRFGDGPQNLKRAFYACGTDLAEVMICFDDVILRGCRADKVEERRFRAFDSPGFRPIGWFQADRISIAPFARRRRECSNKVELHTEFASGIFPIRLIPGIEPSLIKKIVESSDCRGLFLEAYGAGNVPSDGPIRS